MFKELRNDGTLQQLKDKKVELENDEMSLTEDFDLLVDDLIDDYADMIVSKADIEAARQEIASHYNEEIADRVADELTKMIDTVDESLKEGFDEAFGHTSYIKNGNIITVKESDGWGYSGKIVGEHYKVYKNNGRQATNPMSLVGEFDSEQEANDVAGKLNGKAIIKHFYIIAIKDSKSLSAIPADEVIDESLNESELNEASADKQRFIDKFGQENFDTF